MIEIAGCIFEQVCDAIVISSNGYVNSRVRAELFSETGRQLLKELKIFAINAGSLIQRNGNVCQVISSSTGLGTVPWPQTKRVIAFPTKPSIVFTSDKENLIKECVDEGAQYMPGWACKSNLDIIRCSAIELEELTSKMGWSKVCLPRVGCGSGQLKWEQVKPVLAEILDDRFLISWISSTSRKRKLSNVPTYKDLRKTLITI